MSDAAAYDLLIVGGGINGAAIAREAALNSLSVLLIEKGDLASATSSASTKLIHGGLRYLEYYEFKLVREALIERERLLKAAPHLIYPLEFVLPHRNTLRPKWMIRAGLFLYDHIGGRMSLPKSRGTKDRRYLGPLRDVRDGFVYSDAWVDDARLVVLNAIDAAENGADIRTRTELVSARREGGVWRVVLSEGEVTARAIVNAGGPWVAEVAQRLGVNSKAGARLIRGSHIIVPRLFEGSHAYILQQPDRRIVFAIPYENGTTLVGTTDVPVESAADARISNDETEYLLAAVNRYFTKQTGRGDIVSTYAGIRSLYDDGASEARQVTRDYVLEVDEAWPPLLSVFGGKITTARHLSEVAVAKLGKALGTDVRPQTRDRYYPGGNLHQFWDWPDTGGFGTFIDDVIPARWPFLDADQRYRLSRAYGTLLFDMLGERKDPGESFGAGLTAVEVDWLVTREWARTVEDILWRRTKLGLTGEVDEDRLGSYLNRV